LAAAVTVAARPAAPVVAVSTDGVYVTAVTCACAWCGSTHTHPWADESDGFAYPPCRQGATAYRITVGARNRIEAIMAHCQTPDDVVGLVPLRIGFAFEADHDEDILGIVADTTLGRFALWLPMVAAVGLADRLVELAERAPQLREAYRQRTALHPAAVAQCPV
jgi:hypothetical protein